MTLREDTFGKVAFVMVICGLLGLTAWVGYRRIPGRTPNIEARVVSIGLFMTRNSLDSPMTIRLSDGSQREIIVSADIVDQCTVGDQIAVYPVGEGYRAAFAGCSRYDRPARER